MSNGDAPPVSPIRSFRSLIGYPCHSLTNSLTDCCLICRLIDVTLGCEDPKLKRVEVVSVVDVEKCVDDSLVKVWKLKFGHEAKFLFTL